jgi:hypothetical protein
MRTETPIKNPRTSPMLLCFLGDGGGRTTTTPWDCMLWPSGEVAFPIDPKNGERESLHALLMILPQRLGFNWNDDVSKRKRVGG